MIDDSAAGKVARILSLVQSFSVPTKALQPYLKNDFSLLANAPRIGTALTVQSIRFGALAGLAAGAPEIAPADGTSYEVLYTTESAMPAVQCGFNDIGVPNTGIFTVEARAYRTYANGALVSQWQTTEDVFKSCLNP
jgi:hypothetical protein